MNLLQVTDNTKILMETSEKQYKYYASRVIDLKEQLDNTPKVLKKERLKLEQEIAEMQKKADKHYENFIKECKDLDDIFKEIRR